MLQRLMVVPGCTPRWPHNYPPQSSPPTLLPPSTSWLLPAHYCPNPTPVLQPYCCPAGRQPPGVHQQPGARHELSAELSRHGAELARVLSWRRVATRGLALPLPRLAHPPALEEIVCKRITAKEWLRTDNKR